jgi:hypothetical protein
VGSASSEGDGKPLPAPTFAGQTLLNYVRFEETRTSRSLEARFTDAAVENVAIPLGAFAAGGIFPAQRHDRRSAVQQPHDIDPLRDDGDPEPGLLGLDTGGEVIDSTVTAIAPFG